MSAPWVWPLPSSRVPGWTFLTDLVLGWRERRSQGTSPRALAEYQAYYDGLYQERSPDPALFERLLRRNGSPDLPNPFPPGTVEHYRFHPDGLLWADAEALIGQALNPKPEQHDPATPERSGVLALVEASEAAVARERVEQARLAGWCWAHLFAHGVPWASLHGAMHPDNRWVLGLEVASLSKGYRPWWRRRALARGLAHAMGPPRDR